MIFVIDLIWVRKMKIYNRAKAVEYANRWWNSYNPDYRHFEDDCTNYISQCLFAGGAPMTYGSRASGWWYKGTGGSGDVWSYSWTVAHALRWYLTNSKTGLTAKEVDSSNQLTLGDVICYDFDGDGRWQHNAIVTAIGINGMPLVNAHTVNAREREWSYRDSYAWTPKINYKFFHITDKFN